MSTQNNYDQFPFVLSDDLDSAIAEKWTQESGAFAVLDTGFDGPDAITPDDLDALAYGSALSGLI